MQTSPPLPPISRRALLRWSTIAVTGAAAVGLTACGASDDDSEPDPLLAQAERARVDAATATALVAVAPEIGDALTAIANERTIHAEALDAETARAIGATDATTSPSTTTSPATGPAPTVEDLRGRLIESRRSAAELARTLQGYRAGLLGSISAACAAQTEVLLP